MRSSAPCCPDFRCRADGGARRLPRTTPLRLKQQSTDASEAAALVLATQGFVADGGGRRSDRRRRSAASPGRTGSLGRLGRRGCWRSGAQVINRLRTTSRMLGAAAVGARPRQQRRRVATTGGYLVANRGASSARVRRPRGVRTRLSGCEDTLPSLPFGQRGAPVRVSQRNGTAGPPTIRLNVLLRRRPRW